MCIAFIELPAWATENAAYPIFAPLSPIHGVKYPTWELWVVPPFMTMSIDMFCICGFALEMFVKYRFMGQEHFLNDNWNTCKVILIVISVGESIIAFAPILFNRTTVSRIIRPFFFIGLSSRLRMSFYAIMKSLRPIGEVLGLIVCLILVASWAAMLLFESWSCREEVRTSTSMPCFLRQADQLLVLLTTANYPDVMMPVYNETRWSVFFFIVYLMLGLFGLLNLVLAVTYHEYRKQMLKEVENRQLDRDESLRLAFDGLDLTADGRIQFPEWKGVLEILRPDLREHHAMIIFKCLDVERSGYIDEMEFRRVVDAYGMHFKRGRSENDPGVLTDMPWEQLSTRLKIWRCVKLPLYRLNLRGLLICNLIFAAVATEHLATMNEPDLKHILDDTRSIAITVSSFIVNQLLNIDLLVKVCVLGWGRCMEKIWRRFDLIIGLLLTLFGVWLFVSKDISQEGITDVGLFRLFFFCSLVRSMRLMAQSARMSIVIHSLSLLLAPFFTFLGILFVVIYVFATIGIELFGGLIYKGNPLLLNSTFDTTTEVGYYANNYNDYASGMVTCWELLIVNNWFIIMDGFVLASGTQWARLYFVAYYTISVVITLNLFTSFVLEAVTKVDPDDWSGTPHGELFETSFAVNVNEELLAEGGGRWRMQSDMRRSFVHDPFEDRLTETEISPSRSQSMRPDRQGQYSSIQRYATQEESERMSTPAIMRTALESRTSDAEAQEGDERLLGSASSVEFLGGAYATEPNYYHPPAARSSTGGDGDALPVRISGDDT